MVLCTILYQVGHSGNCMFSIFLTQHSALDIRNWLEYRISPARRGGYFVHCTWYLVHGTSYNTPFLPYSHWFHFSLLVQDFVVIGSREEDEISQLT